MIIGLSVREKKTVVNNMVVFTGWFRQYDVFSCTVQIEGVTVRYTVIDGGFFINILNVELLFVLGLTVKDLSVCFLFFNGVFKRNCRWWGFITE